MTLPASLQLHNKREEGILKKRDGLFVLGLGGMLMLWPSLTTIVCRRKKEGIQPIRKKVVLTISSSPVRAEVADI